MRGRLAGPSQRLDLLTRLLGRQPDELRLRFRHASQTKATAFIAAGAAGTTGAVVEPYNFTARFANSSIDTFIADGSTLGEAFAKSVATPDIQMPLGDMLAQPFADVPIAAITSSPGNYGTALGTISIGGSATLVSPHIATGIAAVGAAR